MKASMTDWQWVPWVLIVAGWFVGRHFGLVSHKKNETNNKIRDFIKLTQELEQDAINFWVKKDSIVLEAQLRAKLKRVQLLASEISNVDFVKEEFPTDYIKKFRQAITKYDYVEIDTRPIDMSSIRLQSIVNTSFLLQGYFQTIS